MIPKHSALRMKMAQRAHSCLTYRLIPCQNYGMAIYKQMIRVTSRNCAEAECPQPRHLPDAESYEALQSRHYPASSCEVPSNTKYGQTNHCYHPLSSQSGEPPKAIAAYGISLFLKFMNDGIMGYLGDSNLTYHQLSKRTVLPIHLSRLLLCACMMIFEHHSLRISSRKSHKARLQQLTYS